MGTTRQDHVRKLMWRDCKKGETNIRSHYSTRRLWLDKTVSSHLSHWDWLKWYCYLYWLRLYLVMYQTNKLIQSLFHFLRLLTWGRRKIQDCSPLRGSPHDAIEQGDDGLCRKLAQKWSSEGKVNIKEVVISSKIIWLRDTYFYRHSVGQEDYLSGYFVSLYFLK